MVKVSRRFRSAGRNKKENDEKDGKNHCCGRFGKADDCLSNSEEGSIKEKAAMKIRGKKDKKKAKKRRGRDFKGVKLVSSSSSSSSSEEGCDVNPASGKAVVN